MEYLHPNTGKGILKNSMMKKGISIFIYILILVSVLAGCSNGISIAGEENNGRIEGNAPKQPVTLELLLNSPELAEQYNDMAKEYNGKFPEVVLNITILQNDYSTVLKSRLNSGNVPDAFNTGAYNDNNLYKDYVYDLTDEDFIGQIEPWALKGVTLDGRVLAYPWLLQAHSFIYNKKVFADTGITELPRTMKELEEVCRKLQTKGIQPFATGFKEWWVLEQISTQYLAPVRDSYGGDYTNLIDELNSGRAKFGDIKEMANVFDIIDLEAQYGGANPMETDFNMQCALIARGKAAIIHQGTWAEDSIRKINPEADIGFMAAPLGDDPEKNGIMVDANNCLRLYKESRNLKEALEWMRWLVTSDYGKDWVPLKCKQMSTIKGAPMPKTQLAEDTLKFMKENKTYPWFKGYYVDGFEQIIGSTLQEYAAKSKTRAQTMDELSKLYEKAVNAAK